VYHKLLARQAMILMIPVAMVKHLSRVENNLYTQYTVFIYSTYYHGLIIINYNFKTQLFIFLKCYAVYHGQPLLLIFFFF
jgi:hypothetical protein